MASPGGNTDHPSKRQKIAGEHVLENSLIDAADSVSHDTAGVELKETNHSSAIEQEIDSIYKEAMDLIFGDRAQKGEESKYSCYNALISIQNDIEKLSYQVKEDRDKVESLDQKWDSMAKEKEVLLKEKSELVSKNLDLALETSSLRTQLADAQEKSKEQTLAMEEARAEIDSLTTELSTSKQKALRDGLLLKQEIMYTKNRMHLDEEILDMGRRAIDFIRDGSWEEFWDAFDELNKDIQATTA